MKVARYRLKPKHSDRVTIVEFSGIPYAGKTSLLFDIESHLRQSGVSKYLISKEYRGDRENYAFTKTTSALNIRRAFHAARIIRAECLRQDVNLIFFDRGILDSIVWLERFVHSGDEATALRDARALHHLHRVLEICLRKVSKYHVVWIDESPLIANTRHARQGRIVNFRTLTDLSENYRRFYSEVALENLSVIRVVPSDRMKHRLAEDVLSRAGIVSSNSPIH